MTLYGFPFFIPAAKICQDLIEPLVPQMDRDMQMDPSIVETLFENGVSKNMLI